MAQTKPKAIRPPNNLKELGPQSKNIYVFLGGSIDMGKAVDWQSGVEKFIIKNKAIPVNPRRPHWDMNQDQSINNSLFREQVEWELEALEKSDIILFYFDPKGKAPITLLELGLHAKSEKVLVCCPEGYWRKGNVDIVCEKYHIPLTQDHNEMLRLLKDRILEEQASKEFTRLLDIIESKSKE